MWYGWKTWQCWEHEVDMQHATAVQGAVEVGHGVGHFAWLIQLQHVEVLQLVHWAQVVAAQPLVVVLAAVVA
jgi:hypothetical protein